MPYSGAVGPQAAAARLLQNPRFHELTPADQAVIHATAAASMGASQVPPGFQAAYRRAVEAGVIRQLGMTWWEKAIAFGGPAALTLGGALLGTAAAPSAGGAGAAGSVAAASSPTYGAGAPAFASGASAAGAALTGSRLAETALRAGIPIAATALATRGGAEGPGTSTGLPPALEAQLLELLKLQRGRAEREDPLHAAAIAMAQRLAPRGDDPRIQAAAERSLTPRTPSQSSPQVLEAVQRLMRRY